MTFWIILWKVVLIAGMAVFAGMAVWVTIGGVRDIKRLFARLDREHTDNPESQ